MIKIYNDRKEKSTSFEAYIEEPEFIDWYLGFGSDELDAIEDLKPQITKRLEELNSLIELYNNIDFTKYETVQYK